MPYNNVLLDQSAVLCREEAVVGQAPFIKIEGSKKDVGIEAIICIEGQGPRPHPTVSGFSCTLQKGDLLILGLNYTGSKMEVTGSLSVQLIGGMHGSVTVVDPVTSKSYAGKIQIKEFFIPRISSKAKSGASPNSLRCGVADKVLQVQIPTTVQQRTIEALLKLKITTASHTKNATDNPNAPRPKLFEIRARQQLA